MQLPRARRAFRRRDSSAKSGEPVSRLARSYDDGGTCKPVILKRCFDQRCGIALEIPDIGKRVQRKAFGAAGRQFWAVAPKITERSRGGAVQACISGQPKPNDGVGARQAKMEGAEAGSIHDPALLRHGHGDPAVDLVARSLSPARLPVEVAVHGDVVKVERSRKPRCERALTAAGAADHRIRLASISGDFNPEVIFIIGCPKKNRGENRRGSIKKQVPALTQPPAAASSHAPLSAGQSRRRHGGRSGSAGSRRPSGSPCCRRRSHKT